MIFLDLDGVIINWNKGVCDWFKIPYEPEKVTKWNIMTKLTNTTNKEFWLSIKCCAFWENLHFYPGSISFIKKLERLGTVILCTSPAIGCAGYRQNWIQYNLPDFFKSGNYIITPNKWLLSKPGSILIDDSDDNCDKFYRLGNGYSVIYPQPWNSGRHIDSDKHELVLKSVAELKRSGGLYD